MLLNCETQIGFINFILNSTSHHTKNTVQRQHTSSCFIQEMIDSKIEDDTLSSHCFSLSLFLNMALSSSKPNSAGATAASSQVPNLGTILRHFIGLDLTIELKNGRIYRGQLQEADDYMNLVIRKIENENEHSHQMQRQNMHQDRQQNDNHHDNDIDFLMIHIRGPSIRYIHFPANADLPRLVKLGLDRVKTAKDKYERGKRKERS